MIRGWPRLLAVAAVAALTACDTPGDSGNSPLPSAEPSAVVHSQVAPHVEASQTPDQPIASTPGVAPAVPPSQTPDQPIQTEPAVAPHVESAEPAATAIPDPID